jgi:DNA-binding CsgD family transcriptional regulator
MGGMAQGEVVGRDAELEFVEGFLDEVRSGPAALVLSGEPGIGKTILWRAGLQEARARCAGVLTCRGVEAEAALAFAALSELLSGVPEEALGSLLPTRRRALEVALRLAEPGEGPPDQLAIGLAVHDVLQAVSQEGPLLVAVDDVQWLDRGSAGVLEIALRRLRDEPVGFLATARSTEDGAVALGLDRSLPEERLTLLSVGPLSLGALHRLLAQRVGLQLTRSELARVHAASMGNPYFALELGRELTRSELRPVPGQSLRVPASLRDLLGGRLAQLPAETSDVLLEVSALARPTVELVAASHGDLERVREAISVAAAEEIVELDDSRVRFAHPLLASICYERAPVWKRREVHRALAETVPDPEERARHLALAAEGPDPAVAAELDRAAEQAAGRGATAAAADLSELAAGLTGDDLSSSRRRRLTAARYHRLAGDQKRAAALIDELLPEVPSGAERADVLLELMTVAGGDNRLRKELFDEALAEAAGDDARSASVLSIRSVLGLWDQEVDAGFAAARFALDKAEQSGDPRQVAGSIAHLATVERYAGELSPGMLERGVEIEERLERQGVELVYHESPRYELARLMMGFGQTELPRQILEELEAKAVARGDEYSTVMILWSLSMLEWIAGRWQHALARARAAHELGEQARHPHGRLWVGRMQAKLEADLGMVEPARASAGEALAFAKATSNQLGTMDALASLGRLELQLGELESAAGYLRDLPAQMLASGMHDPTSPIWADAIETLIAVGEVERARAYLGRYEAHARRLNSPVALTGAKRCHGLLAAVGGDLDAALQTLAQSLTNPNHIPPLEQGRSWLALGTVRRRAMRKKPAREALEQALAIFDNLGAPLWAERARAELARISGRRAQGDELTETETRVAAMAADGLTNKQIATTLFMGVSTVEAHLSHAYRKLGIRSRAGLGAKLVTPVDELAIPVERTSEG